VNVEEFRRTILEPGAAWLEAYTGVRSTAPARRFLLAIAMQESGLQHRAQVVTGGAAGPARGWWQFEQGGGVAGVLRHPTSRPRTLVCCDAATVVPEAPPLWRAIEGHDLLAYALARLLLLTDPYAIPEEPEAAWACYKERLWRPGKPHKSTWGGNWSAALQQYPVGAA
jgi:hypothetical protein